MKKGWQTKTLGEIIQKTETTNPIQSPNAEFDYIDVASISNETFQIKETQHLKGKDAPSRARRLVKTNDVLFATVRPTLRRIAIVPEHLDKQVCSTGYFVFRPKEGIDYRFVFYSLFTENFMGQMESLQKGASYPAVTDEEVRTQLIPIPPLPEQKRIVSILDEAFEGIATAKANAEKNLQNARALFESYLQSVFTQRGKGWVEKALEELGVITSSKRIYKSEYVKDGIPFYRTKEIKELSNGKDITLELFISKKRYYDIKKTFGVPQINDLLMSAVGTIGEIMVIENDDEFYFKDGNIVWFKEFKSLDVNYLKYALTAFVEKIKSLAIGSAYNALTIEKLNRYKISFPESLKDQQSIVNKLDALSIKTQKLEAIYQKKLDALDELKKSLLQKAFNGEL